MKITDVKTFEVGNPWKSCFLTVYIDVGITGLSEVKGGLVTKPTI